ncbi:hypothetical protein COU17_01935 [Candidatus Kaiserbacteria bacterium CG10_big_fil_rev_8_21_14_0_10_49_17]|uniref:Uncharacterized protein n=1 Tax=Candidatus Kaiserbacteria bacterium CG10_big_fil_rev_8_21_14_0_10_49_17 TaxID=1974609 RepID=A0A2M6WEB1_9BACT|nr:MAG: hypothetical protein COU17_01935 [Candidatus Kaiserbacteria bacterium CG10_big_fil_rev_8_21_14_0_10_49_17]
MVEKFPNSKTPEQKKNPEIRGEDRLTPILPIPARPKGLTARQLLQSLGLASALTLVPAEDVSAQERQLSPEQRVIVESIFGADVVAQWEAAGFTFTMPVAADEHGSYIIHIGQTHTSPLGVADRVRTNNMVADFQSKLYDLLLTVIDKGSGVVFGETFGRYMSNDRELVWALRVQLESWQARDIATLADAQDLTELLKMYFQNRGHPFVVAHIPGELVQPLVAAVSSFAHSYVPATTAEGYYLDGLRAGIGLFELGETANRAEGNPDNANAVTMLYLAGAIDLAPAESVEANQRAAEATKAEQEAMSAFDIVTIEHAKQDSQLNAWTDERDTLLEKERVGTLSSDEEVQLNELRVRISDRFSMIREQYLHESPEGQAYQAAQAEAERVRGPERENVVFGRIAEYELQHGNVIKYPIVVYGADHDFAPELIAYNQTIDPEAWKRRLIKIEWAEGQSNQ